MSAPIKTTSSKIDAAPTPHNTPASVLSNSYLKNGNPVGKIPQTINEEDINSALANNPQLLASIEEKLGTLVGQDSGYISSLPQAVRDRIYALKKLQKDLFELEKDFQLEMFELEEKYLQKYAPLHQRRAEIVAGKQEPTANEIEIGKQVEHELESVEEEPEDQEEVSGIPSFWLTAFENLPMVSQTVTDRDAEVLDFLTNVGLEYLTEGKPGFRLVFEFDSENPFFSNEKLVKTYYYQSELGYSGDFIYDHAEGCTINWTDDESKVTVSVEKRKQRNKSTKQVRTIEKITPVESFFNFFDPPKVPSAVDKSDADEENAEDEDDEDEEEDDEVSELESRLALDYAIGEEIKDKLIPRAVDWFTGVAMEFEYDAEEDAEDEDFDEEFDEDDDDGEDDDDDGESEEASDEEDDFASNPKSKEQPPECKQS